MRQRLPQGNVDERDMIEVLEQAVLYYFLFFIMVMTLHLVILNKSLYIFIYIFIITFMLLCMECALRIELINKLIVIY